MYDVYVIGWHQWIENVMLMMMMRMMTIMMQCWQFLVQWISIRCCPQHGDINVILMSITNGLTSDRSV